LTPAEHFERDWALALLEQALDRLGAEQRAMGKADLFARLRPLLRAGPERGGYEALSIERGIAKVRDSEFALALTRWLEELLRFYGDRILPVTPDIARRWGRLSADIGHEGADLLVAATAAAHGLTVATRNVRHFAPTGVRVFDPFKAE